VGVAENKAYSYATRIDTISDVVTPFLKDSLRFNMLLDCAKATNLTGTLLFLCSIFNL
jgi:hypothetical protein